MLRRLEREGVPTITRTRAELELTDAASVQKFFAAEQPKYVVLAAGRVAGIVENRTYPADFLRQNLAIQMNVLQAALESGVKKLLFFASSCMYPRICEQPMAETALLTGVPEPTSLSYAIAKLSGLQSCLAYNQQYGAQRFIPVIPNSVFGPNDDFHPERGHVLGALLRRFHAAKRDGVDEVTLWGTGAPRREFIHADDVASACFALLTGDTDALTLPLNIGTGTDISIKELAETIAGIVGYTGRMTWDTSKPDGAPRKLLDSSRMHAFGWRPEISFETGLRATYNWFQEVHG
jgi:GDP-L-fucose synthase